MAPKQVAECLLTLVMNTLLVVSSLCWPLNRRSLKFIKEKTEKGLYIGLIAIYPPEEAAFFHTGDFKLKIIIFWISQVGTYVFSVSFFPTF